MSITLKDILKLLENSDMIRIMRGKEELISGYKSVVLHEHETGELDAEITKLLPEKVVKFRMHPEIRHKEWRKRGLMEPIHPENAPDYQFSDLQITLYYTIILQNEEDRNKERISELEYRIRCEEARCELCPDNGNVKYCEECSTWGSIKSLEIELEALRRKLRIEKSNMPE